MRFVVFAAAALFLAISTVAHADTTYTTYLYTGNYFSAYIGAYSSIDRVTGSFTLASALAPNQFYATVTPVSFSYTDGVQTITSSSASYSSFADFTTNSNGAITSGGYELFGLQGTAITGGSGGDFVKDFDFNSAQSQGAGSFTSFTTTVPEIDPSLASTGLTLVAGAIAILRRRRLRPTA